MHLKEISSTYVFGGELKRFVHTSHITQCDMSFAIYLPPFAQLKKACSVLYWLSGLTCTDENFCQKAGAFKKAAELGLIIVAPDTSPRGEGVPDDENEAYDFGLGAGFYLNATQEPWRKHYQMESYIVDELFELIDNNFNVNGKKSIAGHSMGGHGALTLGLNYAQHFCSISAFSPIVHPSDCPWGQKAFSNYLGEDKTLWRRYDTIELLSQPNIITSSPPILVDQGLSDTFLHEQLKTPLLDEEAIKGNAPMLVRFHEGYDHSYYFIASFIDSHLDFHMQHLAEAQ